MTAGSAFYCRPYELTIKGGLEMQTILSAKMQTILWAMGMALFLAMVLDMLFFAY
jgi:hypothetical protein